MQYILQILLCIVATGVIAGGAVAAGPGDISTAAIEISRVPPVLTAKWDNALERHAKATPSVHETSDWQRFLASLHGRSGGDQLRRVNAYVNAFRYVSDKLNWGKSD